MHKEVSIPRSGFCWFGRNRPKARLPVISWFQSLGRDSVGLDLDEDLLDWGFDIVSIPRSGFCWFGLSPRVLKV